MSNQIQWHKKYYQKHRKRILEACKKYNKTHKESRKAYYREYYKKQSFNLRRNDNSNESYIITQSTNFTWRKGRN